MRHPALVLTYNRPDSAFKICKQLAEFGALSIFVSIDGGRTEELRMNQEELVSSLQTLAIQYGLPISIRHSAKNLGVAAGVISGLDWFFEQVESGYIFEDDLIFNEDFLDFSDLGLEKFRDDEVVWMISGNQYLNSNSIWTNYPLIWGWATWKSKWIEFRGTLLNSKLSFFKRTTRFRVRQFWQTGYSRALNGSLDSWAVPYASQMLSRQKLGLLPPVNLVSNVGVDNFASHTHNFAWHTDWEIGNLSDFPNFLNAWNVDPQLRTSSAQNKLLEKEIYRIRARHFFIFIYSWLFDSYRFDKRFGFYSRLPKPGNSSAKYYSYNSY